jgi:hypothetical protein
MAGNRKPHPQNLLSFLPDPMSGKLTLLLLIVTCFLVNGCAPLLLTAGAGAGYVATKKEPRNKVETFFDDLGRSIRHTTRKITGAPSGSRSTSTANRGGSALKIQRSTLAPTVAYKGEQVTVTMQYAISGAPKKGVTVREKSSLSKGGKVLRVLKDESSRKENGTWENTLSFAVPKSATSGTYTVNLQVSAQGQVRSARRTFTVR